MTIEDFKPKVTTLPTSAQYAIKGGTTGNAGGTHSSTADSDEDDK